VLYGLPVYLIWRLQSVQNVAARLIFRIRRSEHISPALISLHWLRVPERISFKLAVLTYRSIHGAAPRYLQSSFTRVADMTSRQRLRSSSSHHLAVHPSFYSRQAGVLGFRRYSVEQSSASRHISVITRDFQTAPQVVLVLSVLFRHS